MTMARVVRQGIAALSLWLAGGAAIAADPGCDAQCQAARKAQDPLASVRALVTDSTVAFDDATDPLSIGTQIQPVYSLPTEGDYNVILRAVIPVAGVRNGVVIPALGEGGRGGADYTRGLSVTVVQAFFSPRSDSAVKFGIGPQISLPTRTNEALAGPGWGAGIAAVITGFSGRWSYAGILGQHWGEDGFSLATLQPQVMYNSDVFGGSYIGYANTITYDWSATSQDAWQIPVGLTVGKTFLRTDGYAIDVNLGYYRMAKHPAGGADRQVKFGLSLFWP